MKKNTNEFDYKKLSDYERSFLDKTGYWEEHKVGSRQYARDAQEEEESELSTTTYKIQVRADQCFVPALGCTLKNYMDIAQIFKSKELMNNFISYLFEYAIEDTINGGSPFYYYKKSKTYNFDYPYMLSIIIKWTVSILNVDELEFTKFMSLFSPSKNIDFLHSNYFLISVIFGDTYAFLSPSSNRHFRKSKIDKKVVYYYNPTIVEAGNGEEYFFYAIPISASMILFACEEDTVLYLLEERSRLKLKQVFFGKVALEHAHIKAFFKINFP
jgi:hypothetical protein